LSLLGSKKEGTEKNRESVEEKSEVNIRIRWREKNIKFSSAAVPEIRQSLKQLCALCFL
jgi:hypothetical protein